MDSICKEEIDRLNLRLCIRAGKNRITHIVGTLPRGCVRWVVGGMVFVSDWMGWVHWTPLGAGYPAWPKARLRIFFQGFLQFFGRVLRGWVVLPPRPLEGLEGVVRISGRKYG